MQSAQEASLHLRWLLAWLRDLLALADDLIGWGGSEYLCIHIEFHEKLFEIATQVVSMLCLLDRSYEDFGERLLRRDPDFPSSLTRRGGAPCPAAIKREIEIMLRRFDLAMDDRCCSWPTSWQTLRRRIDAISRWSPP
jgi:hypothetical protein